MTVTSFAAPSTEKLLNMASNVFERGENLLFIFKSQKNLILALSKYQICRLTPKAPWIFVLCSANYYYWDCLGFESSLNIHETETFEIALMLTTFQ